LTAADLVDWSLAQRIALGLAGAGAASGPFDQAGVEAACAEAAILIIGYTGLDPGRSLPAPELIDRAEWSRLAVRSLRELSGGLERRIAAGIRLPGPLSGLGRSLAGGAAAAEAGIAIGYGARRVVGQYDLALIGAERPPRLVFVGPNLASTNAQLGERADIFLRWIALHEVTHAVQFGAVPWLRRHLADLLDRLIEGASARFDQTSLRAVAGRLFTGDPRETIRALLRGELPRLLAGPEQVRTLNALQATMAVIEGHAEHVMDAASAELDPGYGRLRVAVEVRRANRGGLADVIAKLLGMELKLQQYRLGKAFCDTVTREAGVEALNGVWRGPEALPTIAELERPLDWLHRTVAPAPA
jgi:coenzyme F420 biosynthesis associated uncharacterized protein